MFRSTVAKLILVVSTFSFVTACDKGGTHSGGPLVPSAPPPTFYTPGFYGGTITFTYEGENIIEGPAEPSSIRLEVIGGAAGRQQVRIAFVQFSGTSAILPDGQFSIPSGRFPIPVETNRGVRLTTCEGELLFEGTFTGHNVKGTATTTARFVCEDSDFGPVTANGTFEANFGQSKAKGFGSNGWRAIAK